ncbi:MAG: hypothetical protein AAF702_37065 [Chloroflexota bacterium]
MTRLARDHAALVNSLDDGPIVLAHRSKAKAVLVSIEDWDAKAKRLAYLERMALGEQADARIEAGEYHTQEEVDAILAMP